MPLSGEGLYTQIGQLLVDMPDLLNHEWNTPAGRMWLGRASALLEASGAGADAITFKMAVQSLSSNVFQPGHESTVQRMTAILYHALAVAELNAPVAAQNGFIPVGEPYTALAAVARVFNEATTTVLVIDPYADANLLTEFAVQASEGIMINVLADRSHVKPGLAPAKQAWTAQYGARRPLDIRLTPAGRLHDRLIIVDGRKVWNIGQSLNGLGRRSPTALTHVNEETARLKIQAYDQLWAEAAPIP